MAKRVLASLIAAVSISVVVAAPAGGAANYYQEFSSQPTDLYFVNFEGGASHPGVACGVDACASFERAGQTD